MSQLDALRAFAVFGVLASHLAPKDSALVQILPWGFLGVKLFFVLSGFLITGILLKCRSMAERGEQTSWFILKRFYCRRSLRIFPLYYLVLAAGVIAGWGTIREYLGWHLTYTSNVVVAANNSWIGLESHFWSLAVEEQFYLIWPWLILFIPRRYFTQSIYLIILIGPLTRLICLLAGNDLAAITLTPSCLDSLGLGALLATYSNKQFHPGTRKATLTNYGLWLGGSLFVAVAVLEYYRVNVWGGVVRDIFASLFFTWLISRAAAGFTGAPGRILEFKPLSYLGRISYGIYIYHNFSQLLYQHPGLFKLFGTSYPTDPYMQFALKTAFTLLVASASWHLFEQPINNLKKFFEYRKEDAELPAEAADTYPAPPVGALKSI